MFSTEHELSHYISQLIKRCCLALQMQAENIPTIFNNLDQVDEFIKNSDKISINETHLNYKNLYKSLKTFYFCQGTIDLEALATNANTLLLQTQKFEQLIVFLSQTIKLKNQNGLIDIEYFNKYLFLQQWQSWIQTQNQPIFIHQDPLNAATTILEKHRQRTLAGEHKLVAADMQTLIKNLHLENIYLISNSADEIGILLDLERQKHDKKEAYTIRFLLSSCNVDQHWSCLIIKVEPPKKSVIAKYSECFAFQANEKQRVENSLTKALQFKAVYENKNDDKNCHYQACPRTFNFKISIDARNFTYEKWISGYFSIYKICSQTYSHSTQDAVKEWVSKKGFIDLRDIIYEKIIGEKPILSIAQDLKIRTDSPLLPTRIRSKSFSRPEYFARSKYDITELVRLKLPTNFNNLATAILLGYLIPTLKKQHKFKDRCQKLMTLDRSTSTNILANYCENYFEHYARDDHAILAYVLDEFPLQNQIRKRIENFKIKKEVEDYNKRPIKMNDWLRFVNEIKENPNVLDLPIALIIIQYILPDVRINAYQEDDFLKKHLRPSDSFGNKNAKGEINIIVNRQQEYEIMVPKKNFTVVDACHPAVVTRQAQNLIDAPLHNSLIWSVILGVLLPAINDEEQFTQRYKNLFPVPPQRYLERDYISRLALILNFLKNFHGTVPELAMDAAGITLGDLVISLKIKLEDYIECQLATPVLIEDIHTEIYDIDPNESKIIYHLAKMLNLNIILCRIDDDHFYQKIHSENTKAKTTILLVSEKNIRREYHYKFIVDANLIQVDSYLEILRGKQEKAEAVLDKVVSSRWGIELVTSLINTSELFAQLCYLIIMRPTKSSDAPVEHSLLNELRIWGLPLINTVLIIMWSVDRWMERQETYSRIESLQKKLYLYTKNKEIHQTISMQNDSVMQDSRLSILASTGLLALASLIQISPTIFTHLSVLSKTILELTATSIRIIPGFPAKILDRYIKRFHDQIIDEHLTPYFEEHNGLGKLPEQIILSSSQCVAESYNGEEIIIIPDIELEATQQEPPAIKRTRNKSSHGCFGCFANLFYAQFNHDEEQQPLVSQPITPKK